METSDTEIIEKILDGETALFDTLVERHLSSVYNLAFRLTQNKEVSEEIAQDAFIKIWKQLKKYNPEKNFRAWLLAIAHNTTIDWFRKKKPIAFSQILTPSEDLDFDETLVDEEPLADELFEKAEETMTVRKALDTLPLDQKTIILLHLDEGLTFDEIAELLQRPINTIKSSYRRSLIKLKKILHAPK